MVTNNFRTLTADVQINRLHSLLCRSEMKCNIAMHMHDLIALLTIILPCLVQLLLLGGGTGRHYGD